MQREGGGADGVRTTSSRPFVPYVRLNDRASHGGHDVSGETDTSFVLIVFKITKPAVSQCTQNRIITRDCAPFRIHPYRAAAIILYVNTGGSNAGFELYGHYDIGVPLDLGGGEV